MVFDARFTDVCDTAGKITINTDREWERRRTESAHTTKENRYVLWCNRSCVCVLVFVSRVRPPKIIHVREYYEDVTRVCVCVFTFCYCTRVLAYVCA